MRAETMQSRVLEPEQVLQIGSPTPLNGVLCRPEHLDSGKPIVVILNSGLLHHVGSSGFSVKLARLLASKGFASYRFDFSGIGDSPTRRSNQAYEDRMQSELVEVMDYLEQQLNVSSFIGYGLCSGAMISLKVAALDSRMVGVAQIAGEAFRTRRWYLNYLRNTILNPEFWQRQLAKLNRTNSEAQQVAGEEQVEALGDQDITLSDRGELTAAYTTLIERGAQCLIIMTRGEIEYYNYAGQLADMFPQLDFNGSLTEHLFPNTRHSITEPDDQSNILALVSDWVETHYS